MLNNMRYRKKAVTVIKTSTKSYEYSVRYTVYDAERNVDQLANVLVATIQGQ